MGMSESSRILMDHSSTESSSFCLKVANTLVLTACTDDTHWRVPTIVCTRAEAIAVGNPITILIVNGYREVKGDLKCP